MFRDIPVNPEQDVLPAACGYFGRGVGEAAATLIQLSPVWLNGNILGSGLG
jgi:hypothetical protein